MLKKIGLGLLAALVVLALVLTFNTLRQASRQIAVAPPAKITIDENAAADLLAQAMRLKTVAARDDPQANVGQFAALQALFAQRFHSVAGALQRETVGHFGLLYTWGGTDPKAAPIVLVAHQDVAPVPAGTEKDDKAPPFSGEVKDGAIWGRGAWDDKANLLAQLQAIDLLIAANYTPRRTVYLAYGADAEIGGVRGAAQIAALLKKRGIRPTFVLGEGLPVLDGVVPGMRHPAALVGVAGEGSESIAIKVSAPTGPAKPQASAAELLHRALARLRDQPAAAQPNGLASATLDALAPEMGGLLRVEASNLWLFRSLVKREFDGVPGFDAWQASAPAPAVNRSDSSASQPAGSAEATVDVRILPGDTPEAALGRMRKAVAEVVPSGQFELTALPGARSPSAVASADSVQYQALSRTIREMFPDAVVAPALAPASDASYFDAISDHVFRFSPLQADAADWGRLHGADERMSVANYANAIRFYYRLIPQLSGPDALLGQ